jgi:hypothetical protein
VAVAVEEVEEVIHHMVVGEVEQAAMVLFFTGTQYMVIGQYHARQALAEAVGLAAASTHMAEAVEMAAIHHAH